MKEFWDRALFGEVDARPLAAMRIGMGAWSFWALWARWGLAESAYSDAGWMPATLARSFLPGSWSPFLLLSSPLAVKLGLLLGLVAAICMSVGVRARVSAAVTFVVLACVHSRNPILVFGGDSVVRMMVLYLALARCGAVWSVDSLVQRQREYFARISAGNVDRLPVTARRTAPVWPLRLMQFQVGMIYLNTGLVKCFGPSWKTGNALWFALVNPLYSRFNPEGNALPASLAPLLRWATWSTLGWELGFPVLVLWRWTRIAALGFGVAMHLGVWLTLEVQWFTPAILTSYFAFIPGRQLRVAELWAVRRLRGRLLRDAPRVIYDDGVQTKWRLAWLMAGDHLRVLELIPVSDEQRWKTYTQRALGPGLHVVNRKGELLAGARAFRAVAAVSPALGLVLPLVLLPGVGHALRAAWLAVERTRA